MNRQRTTGFTLIELMVVMVIIAMLAAITIGATKYAWAKAANSRAQGEIATMESSLESYRIDNGIFPDSTATRNDFTNNCSKLYAALALGPKKYFNFKADQIQVVSATQTNIIDPYGHAYNYYCAGGTGYFNKATFDLWSYGADRINNEGTNDDLTNWRR